MRSKTLVLLIAIVCGSISAVGISQWMQAQSSQNQELAMVEIFVTTKAIDVAEEITAEKIKLEQWPADRVPEGSTSNLEDLNGKYARQRFYAGEPVMPVKLMNDSNGTSQRIPRGYTVVAMKADPENAVANLVRPGDRVDVMAFFRKNDIIPETTAKTILRGVRVFALDGQTQREDNNDSGVAARTVSLLIRKTDQEVWTLAKEQGKIHLTLGNLTDYEDVPEDDAGQEFLNWIADAARAKEAEDQPSAATLQTPTITSTPVETVDRKDEFRMTKLSGDGRIVEYAWQKGERIPRVISDSGSSDSTAESGNGGIDATASGQDDYSYLNGEESPFFAPEEDANDAAEESASTP